MKSTGMVRKIDELGRVVIPIEIRRTMNLNVKDSLEIFTDEDAIILKKYSAGLVCDITGEFSVDNKKFADGKLTLSKEGAAELMEEIKRRFGDTL
ncbi:AbrB/MazE/SpoVT family DNA-binding domain-containing protein [Listeria sp. FSL L7-0091]|uniref:AbrB/MazE/SpoVT family DNA-binding domain-containing protein n=1 Tax=Listeria farberi TaxID=2713500 RepID=A0A7X1DF08_9LIST|nr:AbrB/MazE/SpoVT family DNA-binding domain-containing protein [Listeria farberi]MBC1376007.1 AbrB/MazE/SpoVT family DNA-binding domain-containing protein [Listeria farberi]MBC1381974.1 AbrB/MazE/SpoVT family DNA-binding domain-containing protein [Listeria farberi]MBC2261984.1 AbrB/MazE/SpoVT family DNA-binding domain-containing protein [Listeria farberi]MBC2268282.1 AbrB/MazE/SpoVT family DNA-binding domain-containing protein [Listeria farberi]MBC2288047.1 AbrB/MazE/SpoVT family DNA-binding 